MMNTIYLDHNATTPLLPQVWDAMRPLTTETFGNPSSAHAAGRKARQALEDARETVARLLGAFPDEVTFTSGATEANNIAVFGLVQNPPPQPPSLQGGGSQSFSPLPARRGAGGVGLCIASQLEHPCVIEPLRQLESRGTSVEW